MYYLSATELIPLLLVIRDRFTEDDKSRERISKLVDDLIPLATEEFLIRFGLIAT